MDGGLLVQPIWNIYSENWAGMMHNILCYVSGWLEVAIIL